MLSEATAVTVTVPDTLDPAAGDEMETLGGIVSEGGGGGTVDGAPTGSTMKVPNSGAV